MVLADIRVPSLLKGRLPLPEFIALDYFMNANRMIYLFNRCNHV